MPWREESTVSQRLRLVEQLLLPNANVSAICESFNISRKTAYKWLSRYQNGGVEELGDLSKSPKNHPRRTCLDMENQIIECHKEFPYWGPRKLRSYFLHVKNVATVPTHTTFARVLKRNNCDVIKNNKSKPATSRFEREKANELWQMDFKGSFMTGQSRCYPLTILDDYSRFSIALKACANETAQTVKERLITVFKEFGMPEQINVDNGNPWGTADLKSYTSFQVWLMKLGVRVTHSAPYHPQTNGKDERFHRTLKLEVLHQKNYNEYNIQNAFDDWRHLYNYQRPHDALGGRTPSHRYSTSSLSFPEKLAEPEYQDAIVRKAQSKTGTIRFKGKRFYVGKAFSEELVAIKETADSGVYAIFFMDNLIKKINYVDGVT